MNALCPMALHPTLYRRGFYPVIIRKFCFIKQHQHTLKNTLQCASRHAVLALAFCVTQLYDQGQLARVRAPKVDSSQTNLAPLCSLNFVPTPNT
tara:strand:- start:57 stop:338 length:282 start_codon:yes stop_codon:yes gene_type:complete